MLKRMKHPQHGFHHAETPHQEAAMRQNGWVDDVPEPKKEVEPEVVRRKPGRPPKG